MFIFKDCIKDIKDLNNSIEIGSILSNKTAWSTNIENIMIKSQINSIKRIEKSYIYIFEKETLNTVSYNHLATKIYNKYHDRMTEQIYYERINNFNIRDSKLIEDNLFKNKCENDKLHLLKDIDKKYGLSLDDNDFIFIFILNNIDNWINKTNSSY